MQFIQLWNLIITHFCLLYNFFLNFFALYLCNCQKIVSKPFSCWYSAKERKKEQHPIVCSLSISHWMTVHFHFVWFVFVMLHPFLFSIATFGSGKCMKNDMKKKENEKAKLSHNQINSHKIIYRTLKDSGWTKLMIYRRNSFCKNY